MNKVTYLESFIKTMGHSKPIFKFDNKSIQVKSFENGYRGLFASKSFKKHETIISVDQVGGCYNAKRAFEDALEILAPLGDERHHIDDEKFLLTYGMYARYKISDKPDILFPLENIQEAYQNSPARIYETKEHLGLIQEIEETWIEKADQWEYFFDMMELDQDLYEAILAHVKSRMWGRHGIIPIIDMVNSGRGSVQNVEFTSRNLEFGLFANRDIPAGEELIWDYLDNTAEVYWFSYGFLDETRTFSSTLRSTLTYDQLSKLNKIKDEFDHSELSHIM